MKFNSGLITMTRGIVDLVAEDENFAKFVHDSLVRHIAGDWGDLDPEDIKENEFSLTNGFRLFSAYSGDPKIWIITEADRSATTILFPDEY